MDARTTAQTATAVEPLGYIGPITDHCTPGQIDRHDWAAAWATGNMFRAERERMRSMAVVTEAKLLATFTTDGKTRKHYRIVR